ncbi:hypothetical protein NCG97_35320 [Streptomyces lydicamycinicus]|uniref:hypothetical protein n=1 Tax=Streptomyces lydicamycinicus TaxID=1546107 RepID=UPI0020365E68|nr:hypothetical protein [Streptomyces lydicamycinicus]USA04703.1 hypothetical protein NCG97_35320 [Streptomyces lydicamycinicus]
MADFWGASLRLQLAGDEDMAGIEDVGVVELVVVGVNGDLLQVEQRDLFACRRLVQGEFVAVVLVGHALRAPYRQHPIGCRQRSAHLPHCS